MSVNFSYLNLSTSKTVQYGVDIVRITIIKLQTIPLCYGLGRRVEK